MVAIDHNADVRCSEFIELHPHIARGANIIDCSRKRTEKPRAITATDWKVVEVAKHEARYEADR